MSDQHIPTLSSIADQLTARFEGIYRTGNPHELEMLAKALDLITDYAQREERLARLVQQATPEDAA